jgi:hypothetical protein
VRDSYGLSLDSHRGWGEILVFIRAKINIYILGNNLSISIIFTPRSCINPLIALRVSPENMSLKTIGFGIRRPNLCLMCGLTMDDVDSLVFALHCSTVFEESIHGINDCQQKFGLLLIKNFLQAGMFLRKLF